MRKFVYLLTLIFLLSIAAPASAWDVYRCGPGEAGEPWGWPEEVSSAWSDGNNWVYWDADSSENPYMPTSADNVFLNRDRSLYPVLIDSGTAAVANDLHVGYWDNLDAQLDITGGTLDVVNLLSVGTDDAGVTGYLNISGGAITAGGNFDIGGAFYSTGGNAIVNMSGGTVDVSADLRVGMNAGTGDLTLTGGTISADNLLMAANGSIAVSGTGMIILNGDETATINGTYIPSGWLSGIAEFHIVGPYAGKTVVTPEPATLALLGIGGLVLLRRKR